MEPDSRSNQGVMSKDGMHERRGLIASAQTDAAHIDPYSRFVLEIADSKDEVDLVRPRGRQGLYLGYP